MYTMWETEAGVSIMVKLCDLLPEIPAPTVYGFRLIMCDYCKGAYRLLHWDGQAGMFRLECEDCGAVIYATAESCCIVKPQWDY